VGFSPRPVETAPLFLRSMFQLSVSPAAFLRVKAKTALPCLMASLRSASLALRASLISSKATDEGNLSGGGRWMLVTCHMAACAIEDSCRSRLGLEGSAGQRSSAWISWGDEPFLRDMVAGWLEGLLGWMDGWCSKTCW